MSDNEDIDDPQEALSARHKLEKKELQGKIQSLKKGVPKGDKKKNKEMKAQIAILESELYEKHDKEIAELTEKLELMNSEDMTDTSKATNENDEPGRSEPSQQRVSKAQKKREKKALKVKEQAEIAAQAEKDYVNTQRYAEEEKIKTILTKMSLKVKPMIPDGNCLYYAVVDQLKMNLMMLHSPKELRTLTSTFMLSHEDDFSPFLTSSDTGDCYSPEEFKQYCKDVAETTAWGGQLELRALSHILQTSIHVIQADMPTVKIGEEYKGNPLILTYHRHELGLGEHYNSVQPSKPDSNGLS
ncbi:deubiquitinase OTUD6B-like [Styela clava]